MLLNSSVSIYKGCNVLLHEDRDCNTPENQGNTTNSCCCILQPRISRSLLTRKRSRTEGAQTDPSQRFFDLKSEALKKTK